MGMEQRVNFPAKGQPSWSQVADLLLRSGYPVQLRMINGELAFPDETPPENWRELRIGTPGGMITARRDGDSVLLVTWGNADAALQQAWNALTWAFAEAGAGLVATESGEVAAGEYSKRVELPF
jgi:hypothetical protein